MFLHCERPNEATQFRNIQTLPRKPSGSNPEPFCYKSTVLTPASPCCPGDKLTSRVCEAVSKSYFLLIDFRWYFRAPVHTHTHTQKVQWIVMEQSLKRHEAPGIYSHTNIPIITWIGSDVFFLSALRGYMHHIMEITVRVFVIVHSKLGAKKRLYFFSFYLARNKFHTQHHTLLTNPFEIIIKKKNNPRECLIMVSAWNSPQEKLPLAIPQPLSSVSIQESLYCRLAQDVFYLLWWVSANLLVYLKQDKRKQIFKK